MKIHAFRISNFGSIEDVSLEDLTELTILVGKNGSGKTFLLDGLRLFFEEFAFIGGESSTKDNDYLWHQRDTSRPITVNVILELEDEEYRECAKELGIPDDRIDSGMKKGRNLIEATRELEFGVGWKTKKLLWGTMAVVEDNEALAEFEAEEIETPPELSDWKLFLFDAGHSANNIGGARLLVNVERGIAYHSNAELDKLAIEHELEISDEHIGEDYNAWVGSQGFELVERSPNQDEASELLAFLRTPKAAKRKASVDPALVERIRSAFKMIPAARDYREVTGFRTSLIDLSDLNEMRTLSLSLDVEDERKWGTFGNDTEGFLGKRMEPNPERLLVIDKGLRLPIAQLGGGEQGILALEWRLMEGFAVYAIEEPENHLHPELEKRTFRYLKGRSASNQVFVATHSPHIVDKEKPTNNWLVSIEGEKTVVNRCEDNDELRALLLELGVVPSDIYFRDLLVFVEGGTEKEAIFPIWSSKLDFDLADNLSVGLLSIGGDTKLKNNLRIWLEVANHAPSDYFVVLDSHAASMAVELQKVLGVSSDKFYILSEHSIEDYYPPRYIVEALKSIYEIEIASEEVHKKPGTSRAAIIKSILERERKIEHGWKVAIGSYVAKRMKASEVPDEFREILDKIRSALGE